MPGPFDRFNDRAKRVLALAQDEAIRFNHNYIGPEHLLLGLIREGEGVAARVLDQLGVQLSKVRMQVEFLIGRGGSGATPSTITLHPRTKKVIELAIDEAKKLGHSHVGTEHLLLGLVRETGTVASQALESLGVSLEKVRHQVIATLGGARAEPRPDLLDAQGKKRDWYCEDVLTGKLKVNVVYEDERVLAIEHPYPTYVLHGVVIPKAHVASLMAPEALDGDLLVSMLRGVQAIARAVGLNEQGFRLEANAGAPGVTPHMHWHVAGPGLPPPPRSRSVEADVPAREVGTHPPSTGVTGPFDRFTDDGKRVLALAQDEAIRVNHNYIGTEHLLAGLIRNEGTIGANALTELGVELAKVRTALEFIIGRGDSRVAPSDITLSPRTKKVIELAIDEARKLGHAHVGSGHILLGLVREGEGIASGILESLGIGLEDVRKKVLELMAKPDPPAPPAGV
jgi:ATP-dependent Clp protease ATP-binding subunit ClpA